MTRLYITAGALALVIALAGGAWMLGHGAAQRAADQQAARDYQEGRQDADNAVGGVPRDDDGIRDWLRRYAE